MNQASVLRRSFVHARKAKSIRAIASSYAGSPAPGAASLGEATCVVAMNA